MGWYDDNWDPVNQIKEAYDEFQADKKAQREARKMATQHKFEVEYAKSGRAACKACKAKIDKDAVRIGASVDVPAGDDGTKNYAMMGTKWYHYHCFPQYKGQKWMQQNLCDVSEVKGFGALQPADQAQIVALWTALKQGNNGASKAAVAGAPSPSKGPAQDGGSNHLPAAGVKRPAEVPTVNLKELTEIQGVLSDAEFAAVKQVKQEIAKKTVAQLQAMLVTNKMAKSGPKADLIEKIAEAKVMGVLPKCYVCDYKGTLKWSRMDGSIKCGGTEVCIRTLFRDGRC